MVDRLRRREFVTGALAGAAAAAWPFRGRTQTPSPAQTATGPAPTATELAPTATRLAPNLAVLAGAGANIAVLAGADGALLVDTGLPNRTNDVLDAVAKLTGRRKVALAFDTSWRPAHSGGNAALRGQGATIMAQQNTKLWIGADFEVAWEHRRHAPLPQDALPDRTFYTDGRVEFGGGRIEYGYLPQAHTDGDIYVRFPEANVLAVGELLAVGTYPVVDYVTGGWIGGLERATQRLLELADDETRIVPARGPVQGRRALADQLTLCTAMREAVRDAYKSGHSLEEFMASKPTAAFDARRGDPALFLRLVYRGAWGHVRELGGGII